MSAMTRAMVALSDLQQGQLSDQVTLLYSKISRSWEVRRCYVGYRNIQGRLLRKFVHRQHAVVAAAASLTSRSRRRHFRVTIVKLRFAPILNYLGKVRRITRSNQALPPFLPIRDITA